jgi:hypothetical protein
VDVQKSRSCEGTVAALHRLFTSGERYELVHIGFQLPLLGDFDLVVRILLEGCLSLGRNLASVAGAGRLQHPEQREGFDIEPRVYFIL